MLRRIVLYFVVMTAVLGFCWYVWCMYCCICERDAGWNEAHMRDRLNLLKTMVNVCTRSFKDQQNCFVSEGSA
jgi:hypothetical protein